MTTYAGNGFSSLVVTGDGGKATSAAMGTNYGCAFDTAFNLYVIPTDNAAVRRVAVSNTIITRYAGNGKGTTTSGDGGPATAASFKYTNAIFMDTMSNLFIAEQQMVIRKVSAIGGLISTFAGMKGVNIYSGTGGPATSASFDGNFNGVIGDSVGNIFLRHSYRIHRVDHVSTQVNVIAGNLFILLTLSHRN
jgi:hypothetical protein